MNGMLKAWRAAMLLASCCAAVSPTWAQDAQSGQAPLVAAGKVGQRQTREEAAPNLQSLRRVQNRISNRVQSRLRNRIDRFYDPQANATSPFEVASDQARTTGRPAPR